MPAWWESGLAFACQRSAKCCHARGGYAHVFLSRREQRRIARRLGLPLREFLERYTVRDDEGHVGLRFAAGRCVLLDGRDCSVHESKPEQCRTWPFWPELLSSRTAWEREVVGFCPGASTGPVVPAGEIRRQLAQIEAADAEEAAEAEARARE